MGFSPTSYRSPYYATTINRVSRLNAMNRFCHGSLCFRLNILIIFPPVWGMLRMFTCVQIFLQTNVCVCCVFCDPIYSGRQVCGRTSRGHTGGRSHRISHAPSFCGACLDFSREKDSVVPFPRRPQSRILCTNELIVLHLLCILFLYLLYFFVRKMRLSFPTPTIIG